jgi:hypothetical protein
MPDSVRQFIARMTMNLVIDIQPTEISLVRNPADPACVIEPLQHYEA